MNRETALYNYVLRLGDNALILSYRLSEWCSKAPMIEEDLALTNFALDMIGRAQAYLKYAGEIEGKGRTDDDLAYRRPERQFYNNLITELPNGDFAYTIARQLFISVFECFLFEALQNSKDETIAAIAAKTLKEVRYHRRHAEDWVLRLGDGSEESYQRMQHAVNALWMYTGELFEQDETDRALIEAGIAPDPDTIRANWRSAVETVLKEATLLMPADDYMQTGSRKGIHTEHLGHILSEMQYLQRAYPGATW
ncbi:MAG: phenylacetate-CoA oxygenase subunit PaaI [Bacteroidetes bacterium 46-16]|nr:MAG: phenylacetate-CoA oxygenase subunit PaaI [Bacteroidetes bacterium 46-16]